MARKWNGSLRLVNDCFNVFISIEFQPRKNRKEGKTSKWIEKSVNTFMLFDNAFLIFLICLQRNSVQHSGNNGARQKNLIAKIVINKKNVSIWINAYVKCWNVRVILALCPLGGGESMPENKTFRLNCLWHYSKYNIDY